MSLTYEQAIALRNKHDSHVRAYDIRVNSLVRQMVYGWDDTEIRENCYRALVGVLGDSKMADELISDFTRV